MKVDELCQFVSHGNVKDSLVHWFRGWKNSPGN